MIKERETSGHRTVFGTTGQCVSSVSDVRLDIAFVPDGNTFSDGLELEKGQ